VSDRPGTKLSPIQSVLLFLLLVLGIAIICGGLATALAALGVIG
jgi:hypothetical protein